MKTTASTSQKVETANNMNQDFLVKTFVPRDQRSDMFLEKTINQMCDEFLEEHPELEEISREITSESVDKISACYRTSYSFTFGTCLYRRCHN